MIYGWRGADREALEAAIGGYIKMVLLPKARFPITSEARQRTE